jgi:hypothetical protein
MKTTKYPRIEAAQLKGFGPISLTGTLEIVAAAADQADAVPSFKMLVYTGGLMRLSGWPYPVVVDLAGMVIPSQTLPVRMQHDIDKGVGHTTKIKKTKSELTCEGLISRDTEYARDVINSAKKEFPWQSSMGANPGEVLFIGEKQKVKANGQTFTGPCHHVVTSSLGEVSFVDVGADTNSSAVVAAQQETLFNQEKQKMELARLRLLAQAFNGRLTEDCLNKEILAAAENNSMTPEMFTAHLEELASKPAVNANAATPPVQATATQTPPLDAAAIRREGIQAEADRQKAIRAEATGLGIAQDKVDKLLADPAVSISAARETFLGEIRARYVNPVSGAPAIHCNATNTAIQAASIEAAAYMACGRGNSANALKYYGEQTLTAADKMRGLGVQDLFRIAAKAEGKELPMISMGSDSFIRAAFSVTSLPGILSNLANKILLEGFGYGETTWRMICAIRNLRDFKAHASYRMGANMTYQTVGPGGDLKHGELTEQSFTVQADTKGIIIALTRQMIINDDLGAFAKIPFELGMGANDAINAAVWTLLEANTGSFFSSTNANLPTPASTNALAYEALQVAEKAYLDLKKPNGEPLGIDPRYLCVPTALKTTADSLMKSINLFGTAASTKSLPMTNVHAGKWEVALARKLTSTTSWYLFCDPRVLAAMVAGFLNGIDRPTIDTGEPNFDTLGIMMRAYLDFGVAFEEPRAAIKMATA